MLVVGRHAADAGRRVVPPLLIQEKCLMDHVERPALPRLALEAVILRQRFDAARTGRVAVGLRRIGRQTNCLAHGLLQQNLPFAGRRREMQRPVGVGEPKAGRRNAGRVPAHGGSKQPVTAGRRIDLGFRAGHLHPRLRSRHGSVANCGLQTEWWKPRPGLQQLSRRSGPPEKRPF